MSGPPPVGGATPSEEALRNDVTFVVIMIAFFAVAALFVIACDKIIGSDEEALAIGDDEETPSPEPESLAA
jgi:hypothetical protein